MRVVDPKSFKQGKSSKKRKRLIPVIAVFVFVILFTLFLSILNKDDTEQVDINSSFSSNNKQIDDTVEDKKNEMRIFTDNEFKVFYDNLLQPNLTRVENPPRITGNDIADTRIRKIAEDRGYRLRSSPSIELSSIDGYSVQQAVIEPWLKLKKEASLAGHQLSIVSGYRSVENQRNLFNSRLTAAGASVNDVANGKADNIVNKVLITTSIPGYSKHHTGYTLDFLCAGFAFDNFENSTCNSWLKKENYKNAKTFGFIPSYPPKADAQGPDPEAWEYVWVGSELLYN